MISLRIYNPDASRHSSVVCEGTFIGQIVDRFVASEEFREKFGSVLGEVMDEFQKFAEKDLVNDPIMQVKDFYSYDGTRTLWVLRRLGWVRVTPGVLQRGA